LKVSEGIKDLDKLHRHAQERKAIAWFVSRSGFTADAIQFAKEHNILISDKERLEILRKEIQSG
jgi:hypothetical protein